MKKGLLRGKDIEGMLYYRKVSDELVSWARDEIQVMNKENAIQWKDTEGRTRKTFEFGVSFKEIEDNQRIVKREIPPFLAETRRQMVELFSKQLNEKDPEKYENCIITLYSEGDGIKPHTDRGYFGPDILGLIIVPDKSNDPELSPSTLFFTKPGFKDPICISEEAGIAYLITGDLRTSWNHQLSPVITERISIQFRTMNEDAISVNPQSTQY